MARLKLLSATQARNIISACTHAHNPFDRMYTIRMQEPDRYRYELKVCADCKKAAYAAQAAADLRARHDT